MTPNKGPTRLGDVLSRVFARYGYANLTARTELESAWKRVAGERIAPRSRVGALQRGELEILVESPALLQELVGFHQESLLEQLQEQLQHSKVRKLRFRRA